MAGFINMHLQIYQSKPEAVTGLIIFAQEPIVYLETKSKDQEQFTNVLEKIVADGTDDNEDDDQSEHAIELKHFINLNNGLRKNDRGTQLQVTVNGQVNLKINIAKMSANTPPHNVNRSDGLGGNGFRTQLRTATNENSNFIHHTIDDSGNKNVNEQSIDNRTGGQQQQNNQGSINEIQHQQDSGNNKLREIGSSLTIDSEQELVNPNI
ncbi:MAG: hypothetical protein EZS28_021748 [Streblomastix strix]|uniref:Uncharacterized protein n=1 Tax=Streblomastix strix TaxID=222440 RepID=A0A5J4VKJ1_9EUKA|nr:MAG: hypothetical protein EZS28_021748 [Streblomastix strix]